MATKISKNVSAEPPRVGDRLAHLRQTKGLSLDELSRQAGVSKSMLSQIERGLLAADHPRGTRGSIGTRPAAPV